MVSTIRLESMLFSLTDNGNALIVAVSDTMEYKYEHTMACVCLISDKIGLPPFIDQHFTADTYSLCILAAFFVLYNLSYAS